MVETSFIVSSQRADDSAERQGRPIHVCHIGKYYSPFNGGMESHVRSLAHVQVARGLNVTVACMAHEPRSKMLVRDGGVVVQRIRRRVSFAKIDWLPSLRSFLRGIDCDIFHVHVPNPTMIMGLLQVPSEQPIVVTLHSDHVNMPLRSFAFRPFEKAFFRRAKILAATNPVLASSSTGLAEFREKVRVVPLGIRLDHFLSPSANVQAKAEAISSTVSGPLWLMCGRLVPYKGHSTAIEALQYVSGTLVVIGDGPLRPALQDKAQQLGLTDRIKFLGIVPDASDVQAHFLAAKALWFPSRARSEAFGLVQVEAMASGCPVINTQIPGSGVPWVSIHEQTGLTVPVDNPRELASAAQRLLQDPELCVRLGSGGRIRAQHEFDERLMGERWEDIYGEILNLIHREQTESYQLSPTQDSVRELTVVG